MVVSEQIEAITALIGWLSPTGIFHSCVMRERGYTGHEYTAQDIISDNPSLQGAPRNIPDATGVLLHFGWMLIDHSYIWYMGAIEQTPSCIIDKLGALYAQNVRDGFTEEAEIKLSFVFAYYKALERLA